MAKLTAAQRKTLSKKVVGLPEKKMAPKIPARPSPGGYPGMSAGIDPSKMHSLASMGRC